MSQTRKVLSPREEKFIETYFATNNLSRSYKEAFGVDSPHKAIKLLDTPLVSSRLKKLREQAKKTIQVTSADVIARLNAMSTTSVFDIIDPATGKVREDIDSYTALMVKSIKLSKKDTEFGVEESVQISLNDRTRVLELLGKSIDMFRAQVDLNVTVSVRDQIKNDSSVTDDDVQQLLENFRMTRDEPEKFIDVDTVEVDNG